MKKRQMKNFRGLTGERCNRVFYNSIYVVAWLKQSLV